MVTALIPLRTTTLPSYRLAQTVPNASLVRAPRFGQEAAPSVPVNKPEMDPPSWTTTLKNWVKSPFKLVMALVIGFVSMVIVSWVERWVNDQLAPMMQGLVQQGRSTAGPSKPDSVLPVLGAPIDPAVATALDKRQPLPASFFSDPDAVTRQQTLLVKALKAHKRNLERGPKVTGWSPLGKGGSLGLDGYRDAQGLNLRQWRVALLAQTIYTQLQLAKQSPESSTDPLKSQHHDFWNTVFFEVFRHSGSHGKDKSITDTLKRFESTDPGKARVMADPAWTLSQFWPHRAQASGQKPLQLQNESVSRSLTQLLESTVWPLVIPEAEKDSTSRLQSIPLEAAAVTKVAEGLSRQLGVKPVITSANGLTEAILARQAETVSQLAKKFGGAVWVLDSPLTELPDELRSKALTHSAVLASDDRYPVWVLFPQTK